MDRRQARLLVLSGVIGAAAIAACASDEASSGGVDAGGVDSGGARSDGSSEVTDASSGGTDSATPPPVDAGPGRAAIGGQVQFLAPRADAGAVQALQLALTDDGGFDAGDGGGDAGAELDTVNVAASGPFVFPKSVSLGSKYRVEVKQQPSGQTCFVTQAASGTAVASVSNVLVVCQTELLLEYTGAPATWVVPAGITSARVEAYGAQGSPASGFGADGGVNAGPGGLGGMATGVLAVTPGESLAVFVGGQGAIPTGGFNGGGNGGSPGTARPGKGGGGGGASDVRVGGDAGVPFIRIIAGGGGGGGGAGCHEGAAIGGAGGTGGAGGGDGGAKGADSPQSTGVAGGGFGGSLPDGGSAGIGCGGFLGAPGLPSASIQGGNGGNGQTCCCFSAPSDPGGGGGGGGFIGGGGGGGGSAGTNGCAGNSKGAGGGGAGGTSKADFPGVTNPSTMPAARIGDGLVRILYPHVP